MLGRFLTGIFCGFFTGILPIYLYEISPQNLRGLIGTMHQFNIVLGILTSNILGLPELFGTAKLWPVLVGAVLIPAFVHVFLFAAVKSPKYLFTKLNDRAGAEQGKLIEPFMLLTFNSQSLN